MKEFSSEILSKIQQELVLIDMEDCHISIEESADMISEYPTFARTKRVDTQNMTLSYDTKKNLRSIF